MFENPANLLFYCHCPQSVRIIKPKQTYFVKSSGSTLFMYYLKNRRWNEEIFVPFSRLALNTFRKSRIWRFCYNLITPDDSYSDCWQNIRYRFLQTQNEQSQHQRISWVIAKKKSTTKKLPPYLILSHNIWIVSPLSLIFVDFWSLGNQWFNDWVAEEWTDKPEIDVPNPIRGNCFVCWNISPALSDTNITFWSWKLEWFCNLLRNLQIKKPSRTP